MHAGLRAEDLRRSGALLLVPVLALIGLIAVLFLADPLQNLTAPAPPVEELKVERIVLEPGLIQVHVRADGSQPLTVAQVQVDGAYRTFAMDPAGPIGRLDQARIDIPYPWIDGDTHHLSFVTSTGVRFEHTIDVAQATPRFGTGEVMTLVLVGLLLGVAPVAVGIMFYPAMRGFGPTLMNFVLALTAGLLVFLLIDTIGEGFEMAGKAVDRLRSHALVLISALVTLAGLLAIGRSSGHPPEGIKLALFIAIGIGLHNFGEGLVVGSALATGAAALATFLVTGFVIHNVTEGLGIAAPMVGARPRWYVFVGLVAVAGGPAVFGVLLGAQAFSPFWAALCFGIGAGAIAQVVIEVVALIARRSGAAALLQPASVGGFVAGLAVMYATALLV
ncbi:MAG TPA: metal transporter [Aestuariivirgaceae bacterium]|nr:metal transporter [Aestuariivirgaceae bacterium]